MRNTPPALAGTEHDHWDTLRDLHEWLRTPMLVLSFVWLIIVLAWSDFGIA